jgi:hypothetical protein
MPSHKSREIAAGQVWQAQDGGRWEITQERYDGPGTYRVVKLDGDGNRTRVFDTVWGAELHGEAHRVS